MSKHAREEKNRFNSRRWSVVLAAGCAAAIPATSHAAIDWIGGATGAWTTASNWSGSNIPNDPSEDARIDNNSGQNTVVTYTLGTTATEAVTIGALTIDAGDRLNLRAGGNGFSGTLNVSTFSNSGTFDQGLGIGGNVGSSTFNVQTVNGLTNSTNASVALRSSANNRRQSIFTISAQNQNDGAILVQNAGSDRDGSRLELTNTGTGVFTNNGTITIENTATSGSGSAQFAVNGNVSLAGTGEIILLAGFANSAQIFQRSGTGSTLTNGVNHTLSGAGIIGSGDPSATSTSDTYATATLNVVNNGLIIGTGATVPLRVQPSTTFTNSATGRVVADGAAGLIIGSDSAAKTFTNHGLLEAQTGSGITLTATTTATLNGDIRGGGTITASTVSLTGLASLTPGDSVNPDGTGDSTVGGLDITGNLALANLTTLNFQFGSPATAGTTYDTVAITGGLTLDGQLNILPVAGFDSGTYRLFMYNPLASFVNNGLVLPAAAPGVEYELLFGPGTVDLMVTVPEPGALASLGAAAIGLFSGRRRRAIR